MKVYILEQKQIKIKYSPSTYQKNEARTLISTEWRLLSRKYADALFGSPKTSTFFFHQLAR